MNTPPTDNFPPRRTAPTSDVERSGKASQTPKSAAPLAKSEPAAFSNLATKLPERKPQTGQSQTEIINSLLREKLESRPSAVLRLTTAADTIRTKVQTALKSLVLSFFSCAERSPLLLDTSEQPYANETEAQNIAAGKEALMELGQTFYDQLLESVALFQIFEAGLQSYKASQAKKKFAELNQNPIFQNTLKNIQSIIALEERLSQVILLLSTIQLSPAMKQELEGDLIELQKKIESFSKNSKESLEAAQTNGNMAEFSPESEDKIASNRDQLAAIKNQLSSIESKISQLEPKPKDAAIHEALRSNFLSRIIPGLVETGSYILEAIDFILSSLAQLGIPIISPISLGLDILIKGCATYLTQKTTLWSFQNMYKSWDLGNKMEKILDKNQRAPDLADKEGALLRAAFKGINSAHTPWVKTVSFGFQLASVMNLAIAVGLLALNIAAWSGLISGSILAIASPIGWVIGGTLMVGVIGWTVFKIARALIKFKNNSQLEAVLKETLQFEPDATTAQSKDYDRYKRIVLGRRLDITNKTELNDAIRDYVVRKMTKSNPHFAVELLIKLLREGDEKTTKSIKKLLREDLGLTTLTEEVFDTLANSTKSATKEACTILMVALGIKNSNAYSEEKKMLEQLSQSQPNPFSEEAFQG